MASMFAPNQILKTAAPDFLKDLDLTDDELLYLLDLAGEVKASPAEYAHALDGKNLGMLFREAVAAHQAHLRTRHETDGRRIRLSSKAPSACASR